MDYDYEEMLTPEMVSAEQTEEEKQKSRQKLDASLASATAYIDMAMYLLDGTDPVDGIDLSDTMESLCDARESMDRMRAELGRF